jgi:hypothetical protein
MLHKHTETSFASLALLDTFAGPMKGMVDNQDRPDGRDRGNRLPGPCTPADGDLPGIDGLRLASLVPPVLAGSTPALPEDWEAALAEAIERLGMDAVPAELSEEWEDLTQAEVPTPASSWAAVGVAFWDLLNQQDKRSA